MTERATYRVTYTKLVHDSVDFTADGPTEALEAFWLYVNRNMRDGYVSRVDVEPYIRTPEPGPDQGGG